MPLSAYLTLAAILFSIHFGCRFLANLMEASEGAKR